MGGRIVVDEAGRIHVGLTLRSEEYGVYSEVGYVRSVDGGQNWGDYRRVELMGTAYQGVSTLTPYAFGADEIHLTWHDPRRMHQWSYDGGETWDQPIEIMPLGAAFGGANMLAKDSAGVLHVVTAVANGVFSAAWDGTRWMAYEQIETRQMDPHGQQLIVCQGNQLHVVYDDRVLDDTTVWHASRTVDAPHIERQRLPASNLQPTVAPTPDLAPTLTTKADPEAPIRSSQPVTGLDSVPSARPSTLVSLMLVFLAPAIMVVASILVWRVLQRNRS